jgi:hypothetical protein
MKIFHRIRQNLLAQGRITRYITYAIGEILLVVMGILIALQVNEQNRERHQREEMSTIYASVADELTADINLLATYLPEFHWKSRILTRIVKEGATAEEWEQNDSLYNSFNSILPISNVVARISLLSNCKYSFPAWKAVS